MSVPNIEIAISSDAYLWEGHVGYDDAMQGTWGIFGGFGGVATRVVLVLEMLIGSIAFRGSLPRHGTFGHADGGFGRG